MKGSEELEILIANGADILERSNKGRVVYTLHWKQNNQRFLEILNVTEELTTLKRLHLFTDNLEALSDAIPKKGKLEGSYTIFEAERIERRACEDQRITLLFLKTFRDQNIDLRIVENDFVNAENAME